MGHSTSSTDGGWQLTLPTIHYTHSSHYLIDATCSVFLLFIILQCSATEGGRKEGLFGGRLGTTHYLPTLPLHTFTTTACIHRSGRWRWRLFWKEVMPSLVMEGEKRLSACQSCLENLHCLYIVLHLPITWRTHTGRKSLPFN